MADTGRGGSPPALVKLNDGRLALGYIYRSQYGSRVNVRFSSDNGITWSDEIVLRFGDGANRDVRYPRMVQRPDGRLALFYVFRRGGWEADSVTDEGSTVCVRMSSDNGLTWGEEIVLRGDEGSNYDVGYPRAVLRSDGKIVITYYWNHSLDNSKPPYRYIAATITMLNGE